MAASRCDKQVLVVVATVAKIQTNRLTDKQVRKHEQTGSRNTSMKQEPPTWTGIRDRSVVGKAWIPKLATCQHVSVGFNKEKASK